MSTLLERGPRRTSGTGDAVVHEKCVFVTGVRNVAPGSRGVGNTDVYDAAWFLKIRTVVKNRPIVRHDQIHRNRKLNTSIDSLNTVD